MKHVRLAQFSQTVQNAIRVCRENLSDRCDIDDGRRTCHTTLSGTARSWSRCVESEYPSPLLDAIRAEAAETPHTMAWFKAVTGVTTEAMELADAIRGEGADQ